jgi:hypothetical protein
VDETPFSQTLAGAFEGQGSRKYRDYGIRTGTERGIEQLTENGRSMHGLPIRPPANGGHAALFI